MMIDTHCHIFHEYYDNIDEVINKMETSIKRDFRGYLLSNIIAYINQKCKDYALDVFNNDNIELIVVVLPLPFFPIIILIPFMKSNLVPFSNNL